MSQPGCGQHFRGLTFGSTVEDEFVCIFGSHLTKANRSSLVTFNTRFEEKLVAETDYREYCAMACLDDIVYIMGGRCTSDYDRRTFYEVMTVNLKLGCLGEAEDIIHATECAAAASSLNRIALCGGASSQGCLNYCQMYSPKQNRWTEYAPMTVARAAFALVWSPDGRLFAVGGFSHKLQATSSVEMLNCPWEFEEAARGTWTPAAPMCRKRVLHGACFFKGKLFAAGGLDEESVECFVMPCMGLPDGQWTMLQPMLLTSSLRGLLPFNKGLLMVGFKDWTSLFTCSETGGSHACRHWLKKLEHVSGCCTTKPALPLSNEESIVSHFWANRSEGDGDSFTVCLLAIDKDERDFFKLIAFQASTANEHLITEVPYREDCCIACLKGNIYIIGGSHNPMFGYTPGRAVSKVNVQTGRIERIQLLPQATSFAAVATSSDMIVVCGGTVNGSPISSCQVLSLANEKWSQLPNMQIGRTRLAVAWLSDGRLFAIGGNTGCQGPTATVEMIECTTAGSEGQWTYVAPLPGLRQCHAATVIGEKVVVAGGIHESAVTMFTPPTYNNPIGMWTEILSLPKPMELLALVTADRCIISICPDGEVGIYIIPNDAQGNLMFGDGNWRKMKTSTTIRTIVAACAL